MTTETSAEELGRQVAEQVYDRAARLCEALGARIGIPRSPRIVAEVEKVVRYVQGTATDLSNTDVTSAINFIISVLADTCYPPATAIARTIFDRRSGEPQSSIERFLLAARARWDIELGIDVPIRWLAVLAGVSVKTARNAASVRDLRTRTTSAGQVCTAAEAARWLDTRGIMVNAASRAPSAARKAQLRSRRATTRSD